MKIKEITQGSITFDNESCIEYSHEQDCCEWNYADFEQVEEGAKNVDFKEPLEFERVENFGFRFGNKPNNMFFVPCYSEQNGYYSDDIDIYYNGDKALKDLCCELILD